jgi:hypothetical protein
MLYSIARELEAALKAKHVPFPIVFGPERSEAVATNNRIVFEHGGPGADSYTPPLATHRNPKMHFNCMQGVRLRIFARSPMSNAGHHDHTGLADQVRDAVLCELDVIVRTRKNTWTQGPGGYVPLEDAGASSGFGGVIYELTFSIDRGIERRTWEGAKERDEVEIGTDVTITSTTKVSDEPGAAGTPPVDAEDV